MIGNIMEILSVNVTRFFLTYVREKNLKVAYRINRNLIGKTSLWMWLIYGVFIPFVFVPIYHALVNYNIEWYIRYLIYSPLVTLMEVSFGYILWKFLDIRPWSYKHIKFKITKYGFTTWFLLFGWGFAFLGLEYYVDFIDKTF